MTLTDIIYHGNGFTATFDDNSVANGTYKVVNGILTIIGVSTEQAAAIEAFNNTITGIGDPRFDATADNAAGNAAGIGGGESTPTTVELTEIITNRNITSLDDGKTFYVPSTAGSVIFTLSTGLLDGFSFSIVSRNTDTTLTPASGESIGLSGAQTDGTTDQSINFPASGGYGKWILDRDRNQWVPLGVGDSVAPVVVLVAPYWIDNDVVSTITTLNLTNGGAAGQGNILVATDSGGATPLDISAATGTGSITSNISGTIDFSTLGDASPIDVDGLVRIEATDAATPSDPASGVLRLTGIGSGSVTWSLSDSGGPSRDLTITVT